MGRVLWKDKYDSYVVRFMGYRVRVVFCRGNGSWVYGRWKTAHNILEVYLSLFGREARIHFGREYE